MGRLVPDLRRLCTNAAILADIAFIDSAGVIRAVRTMTPCTTVLAQGCPSYVAGVRYIAALEVNAGFFASRRVRIGDRLALQDTVTRRRGQALR